MPLEIEAKIKVPDHTAVRRQLKKLRARRIGKVLELNTFFDTKNASLLKADRGLRIRWKRDSATKKVSFKLTMKGPGGRGKLKSREELEIAIEDGEVMAEVLGRLGYEVKLRFQKRRETWELGHCLVELDELPHLGKFVEIEGPGEAAIMRVRKQLGLERYPPVKLSYSALVAEYRRKHGGVTLKF